MAFIQTAGHAQKAQGVGVEATAHHQLQTHHSFTQPAADTVSRKPNMASPQLIFVDGTFAELAQEMADYLQIGDQVKAALDKDQREDALQAIVKASSQLNSVPEREFTAAYNLLIHLVLQAKEPKKYLPAICGNLLNPITSSPAHGFTLASGALSTIFNLLEIKNPLRYNVFMQIVRFLRKHNQFDLLKPRLKNLDVWFEEWETDEEDQLKLLVEVSDAAHEAGDEP
jgi:translation initiation factor 3 subunit M